MKKFISICMLAITLILLLAGCTCSHKWQDATCFAPKTCSLCGQTEGTPLSHVWKDATCSNAKTCTLCNTTEGSALDHSWQDATCSTPKTCVTCNATEGEALGHSWQDATCLAPKTCSVCQETEGEVAGHTWTGATCKKAGVCSVCNTTGKKGNHSYIVISGKEPVKNYATKWVMKCETCSKEKTEYHTLNHTINLETIGNKLADYAKSLGFQVSIGTVEDEEYSTGDFVDTIDIEGRGQDYIIQKAKSRINSIYEIYAESPAGIGVYTLHIDPWYGQNLSLGSGSFGVSFETTS